jgi:hypothetical protein
MIVDVRLKTWKANGGAIMKRLAIMAMAATLMLGFNVNAVMAQEKEKAEAKKGAPTVKVLLENDRVKVQEVLSKPGDKAKMTERPDRVMYILKSGEFKRHYQDGKTVDVKLKAGEANFIKKDTSALENVGTTEARWIGIQLLK